MSKKKYLVAGGYVISQSDGDRHYVSARRLMDLYRVRPGDCKSIETDQGRYRTPFTEIEKWAKEEGLVILQPRYDGDYSLPREETPQETLLGFLATDSDSLGLVERVKSNPAANVHLILMDRLDEHGGFEDFTKFVRRHAEVDGDPKHLDFDSMQLQAASDGRDWFGELSHRAQFYPVWRSGLVRGIFDIPGPRWTEYGSEILAHPFVARPRVEFSSMPELFGSGVSDTAMIMAKLREDWPDVVDWVLPTSPTFTERMTFPPDLTSLRDLSQRPIIINSYS